MNSNRLDANIKTMLEKEKKFSDLSIQDLNTLRKIEIINDDTLLICRKKIMAGAEFYRLQRGEHGGSSVFFNRNGKAHRFSQTDGLHGSLYLAHSPQTAMKKSFRI